MKHKQLRMNVFESNSSSSHSIQLACDQEDFIMDTSLIPNRDGNIILTGGEFGWEWEKYNDALTKANYAAEDGVSADLLTEVIKEQTGCNNVFIEAGNGYIDHESVGIARSICTNKENTRFYIFNKKSWLFTGNDNSSAPNGFYDDADVTTYTHRFILELPKEFQNVKLSSAKYDLEWKFKSEPTKEELEDAIQDLFGGIELNKTKNKWEIGSNSWSGSDEHFKYHWSFRENHSFDYNNSSVVLFSDRIDREAEKLVPKSNNSDRGALVKEKENELRQLDRYKIVLPYTVVEI